MYETRSDTTGGSSPFSLYNLDRSAYLDVWDRQAQVYARADRYFSGRIFDEARTKPTRPGEPSEPLYPLRVNVVKRTVITHAQHLWGLSDEGPLLRWTIRPGKAAQSARARAERYRAFLDGLWNSAETEQLLREAARIFNRDGGCYLKLRTDPTAPLGLRLEAPQPQYVYPVWNPANYNDLLRVHIVFPLEATAAQLAYGVKLPERATADYVETWTKDDWRVTIRHGNTTYQALNSDGSPLAGPNLARDPATGLAIIPLVYIPRLRTGDFYGDSLIDWLRGLQNEFNARLADYGDAATLQTHPPVVAHDVSAKRKAPDGNIDLPAGRVYDAGDTGPGGKSPAFDVLNMGNLTAGISDLNGDLQEVLYDQAGLPPVMRGIDEGSQRSALTLAMRALPTLAMITDYRAAFRAGILHLSRAGLLISLALGLNDLDKGLLAQSLNLRYAPVLPKDQDQINQMIQIQRAAGTMSLRRALELDPTVDDVEAELAELQKEQAAEEARRIKQQQQQQETHDAQSDKQFEQQTALQDQGVEGQIAVQRAKPAPQKGKSTS